jgi:cytidine deaminase
MAVNMDNERLIELAIKAREFASPEISGFKVGAALLTKSGEVYLGCNIEDPSGIGVTNICAERCAIIKAISEGHKDFEKIAVVGGEHELVFCTPCGVCRQYMNSFSPDITVICIDNTDNSIKQYRLNELLPYSFNESF